VISPYGALTSTRSFPLRSQKAEDTQTLHFGGNPPRPSLCQPPPPPPPPFWSANVHFSSGLNSLSSPLFILAYTPSFSASSPVRGISFPFRQLLQPQARPTLAEAPHPCRLCRPVPGPHPLPVSCFLSCRNFLSTLFFKTPFFFLSLCTANQAFSLYGYPVPPSPFSHVDCLKLIQNARLLIGYSPPRGYIVCPPPCGQTRLLPW